MKTFLVSIFFFASVICSGNSVFALPLHHVNVDTSAYVGGIEKIIVSTEREFSLYGIHLDLYAGSFMSDVVINVPESPDVLYSSIPEPATMFLLGIGMIGLTGLRRFIN